MSSRPLTARGALLVPGVLLMCVGVWLTAFLYFLCLFGAPLFLTGLALTWTSDASVGVRTVATVFPFAVWIGVVLILMAIGPHAPSTTILVPDGYRGPVVVVYNEPCAPPLPRRDGRRIAALPPGVILIASDTESLSWPVLPRDDAFVAVDPSGRLVHALPDVDYPSSGPDPLPEELDRVGVLDLLGPTTGGSRSLTPEVWFVYQEATVGTIRTWQSRLNDPNDDLSDRIGRAVGACRRAAGLPEAGGPDAL